jgi:DNA replication and repair protein RecF
LRYRATGGDSLGATLAEHRSEDRRHGSTQHGPHRDDLEIVEDDRNLLTYGSAGQVRAALTALTLAQLRRVRDLRGGDTPLLVLDDVDADLDEQRMRALVEAATEEAQVFAATSKPRVAAALGGQHVVMEAGVARAAR